jgi:hypothetical protein
MKHAERSDVPEEGHDRAEDLVQLAALERQARDGLLRAREQLLARDEGFAAVEADLWAGFEERERRHRAELLSGEQLAESLRQQLEESRAELERRRVELEQNREANAGLVEANHRLTVRLERVLDLPPARLYRRLQELPGVRWVRSARTRGFERAVAARRHN